MQAETDETVPLFNVKYETVKDKDNTINGSIDNMSKYEEEISRPITVDEAVDQLGMGKFQVHIFFFVLQQYQRASGPLYIFLPFFGF